jgi:hypothetical protein
MLQFLTRRLLMLVPVLLGILLVTFIITRLVPGDPCYVMLGEKATKEKCDDFKRRYGLNDSIPVQFVRYMGNLAQGDFGVSIKDRRLITDIIAERLPMTMELTFFAMIFAAVAGVSLGVVSALNRNTWLDMGTMLIANVGVSMPVFWLGLELAYIFALLLKGTPFFIPPSSRLSAGVSLVPLASIWNLEDLTGVPRFLLMLVSNWNIDRKYDPGEGCLMAFNPAGYRSWHDFSGCNCTHDAFQPVGSARTGLCTHCPCQRPDRTICNIQTCLAQCAHSHCNHHRYTNWGSPRWSHSD